jgi:hypothetical protein
MEAEDIGVVLAEGRGVHGIKHTYAPKNLANPLSRPGMDWEALHTDLDVVEPIGWPGVGLQALWMDEKDGGANSQGADVNSSVTLL